MYEHLVHQNESSVETGKGAGEATRLGTYSEDACAGAVAYLSLLKSSHGTLRFELDVLPRSERVIHFLQLRMHIVVMLLCITRPPASHCR